VVFKFGIVRVVGGAGATALAFAWGTDSRSPIAGRRLGFSSSRCGHGYPRQRIAPDRFILFSQAGITKNNHLGRLSSRTL
jgi:hypothetical protein